MIEPKEIADKYFERYSKTVSWFNYFSVISILVLFTNWILIVEPAHLIFLETKNEIDRQYLMVESQLQILKTEKEYQLKKVNNEVEKIIEIENSYSESRKPLEKQVEKPKTEKLGEALKVEDWLPKDWFEGIKLVFKICKFPFYGATILSGLFFFFIFTLFFIRSKCLHYLSKALRIYKEEKSLQINQYKDFNLKPSIWLMPLPKIKNKSIEHLEIKTILGLNFSYQKLYIFFISSLFIILLIQFRLAYITYQVTNSKITTLLLTNFSITLGTLILIVFWLKRKKIEDNFNTEPNPNEITRKEFLSLSFLASVSLASYRFTPFILKYSYKRVPRFKPNKIRLPFTIPEYRSSLVLNSKSNIVHYINEIGFSLSFKTISNASNFKEFKSHINKFEDSFSFNSLNETPRISKRQSSWHAENYSLQLIKEGDFKTAVKILLYSINQNIENSKPSIRLHDLLATLCIRHKEKVPKGTLQTLFDLSINSRNERLIAAVNKWKSQSWQIKKLKKKKITFNNIEI